MEYLDIISKNISNQDTAQLTRLIPYWLNDMYKRSTRNKLMLIGAATFLTLCHLPSYFKSRHQKLNLPPHVPFSLPFVGHSLYLIIMPFKFLDWCHGKYGEVYTINMFGKTVTIADGKSAEESMSSKTSEMSLDHGVLRGTYEKKGDKVGTVGGNQP